VNRARKPAVKRIWKSRFIDNGWMVERPVLKRGCTFSATGLIVIDGLSAIKVSASTIIEAGEAAGYVFWNLVSCIL
jgi:hypothetical protein